MTTTEMIDIAYPACVAAYTALQIPPTGFQLIGKIESVGGDTWGFVAFDARTSTGLVAFRGTANFSDWMKDFTALPVNLSWAPDAGCVHEGFAEVYGYCRESLTKLLVTGDPAVAQAVFRGRMIFTGHSLGAALTTLAAYEYRAKGTELVTFAGPRVGTRAFAEELDRCRISSHQRVVNNWDIVPHVPGGIYHHAGTAIVVDGGVDHGAGVPDLAHAHRLPTYLAGLQKLLSVKAAA